MEINKQLFEDVLSGKLKGTFVLRNGSRCSDKQLGRNHNWHAESCPYRVKCRVYKSNGVFGLFTVGDSWDIIDFIPDTDMKENKITIEIPDDKIVDWDESKKQNKIVLKDKQLTYNDVCNKLFKNKEFFFINNTGIIESSSPIDNEYLINAANNSTSYHQLECIIAKNMLANVAKYLNSLSDKTTADYYICDGFNLNVLQHLEPKFNLGLVMFKSAELAQQAIEILGEETIKLALEPLGI